MLPRLLRPILDLGRLRRLPFSNPSALFASLLFGTIGVGVFMYGKKMASWKPMVIGLVLMAYPYFVPQTWLIYAIGCALCLVLYVFRG